MHSQETAWSSQAGGGLAGVLLSGFTRLSKGLAVFLLAGFVISLVSSTTVGYFALIPGKTIPFGWNLVTAGYLERSLPGLIVAVFSVLYIGKILEPVWGAREFLKFIVVVNFLAAMGTFVTCIILYYATTSEDFLYTPISGFHGALSGFFVALKQIMPDQEFSTLVNIKLRAKWMPLLFVMGSIVASFFLKDPVAFLPFILFGSYGAWLYLRYSQRKPETNLRGDPSDEFAFATFFPEFLSPVVNVVAVVFEKIFCGRSKSANDDANGYPLGGKPLPGSDPIDATRRRERGARALEERLNANAKPVEVPVKEDSLSGGVPLGISAVEPRISEDNV